MVGSNIGIIWPYKVKTEEEEDVILQGKTPADASELGFISCYLMLNLTTTTSLD